MNDSLTTNLAQLLRRQVESGVQLGTQVAVFQHGQPIVDLSAGSMGPDDQRPVRPDTLFSSFSTTKGVVALAVHILADRGIIDYDAPVTRYWPAFAQNGKERLTVAHVLSHQAGLHTAPNPLTAEFVRDWEGALRWIEAAKPLWGPGEATGYTAVSWGWLVGGLVQHASGRHISRIIEEDIAQPLGVSGEMYLGIPDGVEDRLATVEELERAPIPVHTDQGRANPVRDFSYNDIVIRRACVPSANGHFTARSLARMYGALANGGQIDGMRLVSEGRISSMNRLATDAFDRVITLRVRKGLGFFLGGKIDGTYREMGPRPTAFGHSGAGGSTAFADPEVGLAVAVTINRMHRGFPGPGFPCFEICELIRTELGVAG